MSQRNQFQPGERVRVTLEDVQVQAPVRDGYLIVNVGCDEIRFCLDEAGVTVVRLAPPFGDNEAWRDRDGLLWVAQTDPDETDGPVWLFSVIGRVPVEDSHQYAPWTRVYPQDGAR